MQRLSHEVAHRVFIALVITAFVSSPVDALAQGFLFGRSFAISHQTTTASVGADFNADGRLDIAVANQDGTVSVALANAAGGFQASVDYPVGASPASIATGDFNGDGKLDIVTANAGGSSVSLLLGIGDGTFQAHNDFTVGPPASAINAGEPVSITVGDFNGDGALDVATANGPVNGNTVSVLLGNGNGTFQAHVEYTTANVPRVVVARDVNGDGKLDLLVLTAVSTSPATGGFVSVLLGKGDGTFAAHVDYATDEGPTGMAVGDFNGDGKPDIAVADFAVPPLSNFHFPSVSMLLNNGDGTFTAGQHPTIAETGQSSDGAIVAADVNGDKILDVIALNPLGGEVAVLIGKGDGTFLPHVDYPTDQDPTGVVAGDFNGDGHIDLAISRSTPAAQPGTPFAGVHVLLGNGDGTFERHSDYAVGRSPIEGVTGDFNHDGVADFAVYNFNDGTVSVALGNGDGTFKPAVNHTIPGGGQQFLLAGDVNGDTRTDLILVSTAGTAAVLTGNADGTFNAPVISSVGQAGITAAVSGDFNADRKIDIAVASSTCTLATCPVNVAIATGNADGTFTPGSLVSITTRAATTQGPQAMVALDANGDGKLDFALEQLDASLTSVIYVSLGNGDGTFQAPIQRTTGTALLQLLAGDLNGDGKADLIGAPLSVMLGNGDGTFQAPVETKVNLGTPVAEVLGDFNHDGKLDIAIAGGQPAQAQPGPPFLTIIFTGRGDGTFLQALEYPAPAAPAALLTGDWNGDGGLDLALVNPALNNVSIVLNRPTLAFNPAKLSFSPSAVGSTSAPQTVTIANAGPASVKVTSVATTGDFAVTNTCGSAIALGTNCAADVTFAPTASGAPSGTLTVSSDAIGRPARIALAVVDFSIAAAAGGTTSQTVTAGQNAVYKLVLSSAGFTGQVAVSCSGAPQGATCAVNPSAVSLSGALTAPFTVTVTTAARSSAQLALPAGSSPGMWWSFSIAPALFGLIWLPGSRVRSRNVYRCLGVLALAVTLVAVMLFAAGCGGGGSNATPVSTTTGTPAGTSTIVVTAASGAVTHSQNLTLTVN